MDLKEFLLDVFPNKDEEKYTKMIDNLKRLGFDSMSDLKYLDEEAIKELDSFHSSDIKKLTDYLANFEFEVLEEVLNEIFSGTQKDRIREIKIFFNKHEVCARSDVLLININEMKAKEFFSESELMRIESFLGKDLIQALREIFSGVDAQRISEIEKILKEQNITAKKDLIYIDTEKFRNGKILADIEVSKIETFLEENYKEQFLKNKETMELEKSKDLRHVLNEIFLGTPTKRLKEIEDIVKKEEIYSGKDVLIADLNSLQLKESLSNAEMLKFEEYLKKKNVVHYEKLMSDRELENSKNLKCVMKQLFVDTPENRLEEIENILKEEQIYSGSHMEIVDTNDLREKKSLSDIEILKIEEYIKKNNRENYDDIKAVKMAENERKFTGLKVEEEIKLLAWKGEEVLKIMQLKAQEEQKMIEFKTEGEKLLREEENMLMKAKAKEEMEKENMKMLREKELMEANAKEEMEREKIKMQREKELREAKLKEEMERKKIKLHNELIKKYCQSLINEKNDLLDDVRKLEKDCIRLKNVITENSQRGIKGLFINSFVKKKKTEDECKELEKLKIDLKSKNDRLSDIDELLRDFNAGF